MSCVTQEVLKQFTRKKSFSEASRFSTRLTGLQVAAAKWIRGQCLGEHIPDPSNTPQSVNELKTINWVQRIYWDLSLKEVLHGLWTEIRYHKSQSIYLRNRIPRVACYFLDLFCIFKPAMKHPYRGHLLFFLWSTWIHAQSQNLYLSNTTESSKTQGSKPLNSLTKSVR